LVTERKKLSVLKRLSSLSVASQRRSRSSCSSSSLLTHLECLELAARPSVDSLRASTEHRESPPPPLEQSAETSELNAAYSATKIQSVWRGSRARLRVSIESAAEVPFIAPRDCPSATAPPASESALSIASSTLHSGTTAPLRLQVDRSQDGSSSLLHDSLRGRRVLRVRGLRNHKLKLSSPRRSLGPMDMRHTPRDSFWLNRCARAFPQQCHLTPSDHRAQFGQLAFTRPWSLRRQAALQVDVAVLAGKRQDPWGLSWAHAQACTKNYD
jgi:hypothetical protein